MVTFKTALAAIDQEVIDLTAIAEASKLMLSNSTRIPEPGSHHTAQHQSSLRL